MIQKSPATGGAANVLRLLLELPVEAGHATCGILCYRREAATHDAVGGDLIPVDRRHQVFEVPAGVAGDDEHVISFCPVGPVNDILALLAHLHSVRSKRTQLELLRHWSENSE